MNSILVPTDFSSGSQKALATAIRLASDSGATLHLLHVVSSSLSLEQQRSRTRLAEDQINSAIDSASELKLKTVKRVVVGIPHQSIVKYATENSIELIVMGTHGRTGLASLALGSVADRVLRASPCPVTVQRQFEGISASQAVPAAATTPASPALDLLLRACGLRASDIHFDPSGAGTHVRFRIDGVLQTYCELDRDVAQHLLNQFKTIARLDIAEPFLPQEGKLELPESMAEIEVRLTCAPVAGGDAMALRIAQRENVYRPLEDLGLPEQSHTAIEAMLSNREGLALITGPTGAGKTTTIYAMLKLLGGASSNIVSIEDPVEYSVPFVRQMNVNMRHGIDMSKGLRTLLRMDPDVIFVGEARDANAAEITMRAASSGRYVLSTLHTRDIAATVTALRDLNVGDRSIAANLNGIINQRLVRRLCKKCRAQAPVTDELRARFESHGMDVPNHVFQRVGCDACRNVGYFGRIGVFEAVAFNDVCRSVVSDGVSEHQFRETLITSGLRPLHVDALEKVSAGVIDEQEASRIHWLN